MKKSEIEEGCYLTLTDDTYCRVNKGWHGLDNSWLEVAYHNGQANVLRSVEFSQIKEIAPEPYSDPK